MTASYLARIRLVSPPSGTTFLALPRSALAAPNNSIDHFILAWAFAGSLFHITFLLPNMLIIPAMPLAKIAIHWVLQTLAADF